MYGGPYSAFREHVAQQQAAAQQALRSAEQLLRTEKRQKAEAQTKLARRRRYARSDFENNRRPKAVMHKLKRDAQESAGKLRTELDEKVDSAQQAVDQQAQRVRRDARIKVELPDPDVPSSRRLAELRDPQGVVSVLQGPQRTALIGPNGIGKNRLVETLSRAPTCRTGSGGVRRAADGPDRLSATTTRPSRERRGRCIRVRGRACRPPFKQAAVKYLLGPQRLLIGRFTTIGPETTVLMLGGDHPMVGPSTYPFTMFGGTWAENTLETFLAIEQPGDTVIGNDVWIGREATLLPGITVAEGAVIGAHSVVTKDVGPYEIVAGNPARTLRTRYEPADVQVLLELSWWDWPVEKITAHAAVIMGGPPRSCGAQQRGTRGHCARRPRSQGTKTSDQADGAASAGALTTRRVPTGAADPGLPTVDRAGQRPPGGDERDGQLREVATRSSPARSSQSPRSLSGRVLKCRCQLNGEGRTN